MKLQNCLLISIIFLLVLIPTATADIIPSGMKIYERCISISNLDEYPDVVFVGYITGPVIQCQNPYVINSSDCLTQFYKANTLTVYAIEKDHFDNNGIEDLDFESESESNYVSYSFDYDVNWGYAVVANPLTREERYYSVAGFNDTALILYEERRVSIYGSVVKNEDTFDKPDIPDMRSFISEPEQKMEHNDSEKYDIQLHEDNEINKTQVSEMTGNSSDAGMSIKDSILSFFRHIFGKQQ